MTPNGNTLHGLEPAKRLRQCVADINQNAPDAELCIATGDLADRGESGAYEMIRTCPDELTDCLLVGNHDDRPTFQQAFPEVPSDPNGFVQYSRKVGDDVLLFLDTLPVGTQAAMSSVVG